MPDEVQGGRTATEAFILKGHRRIGFINNIDAIPTSTFGRLAGYQEVLASYGLAYDERLVQRMQSNSGGGYDGAQALMQLPDPPTAIFCFNDRMAMGAYDAVRKIGRSIPEDVAIIGFDDEEMISAHLYPPLTTVQLPHYEMGQWAIDFLPLTAAPRYPLCSTSWTVH